MKALAFLVFACCVRVCSHAQQAEIAKPGTYLHFGQPLIEDNSFLIEEAFNQEPGSVQHTSNLIFKKELLECSYMQEIPLAGLRHQLSVAISYASSKKLPANSLGDLYVSYRPLIFGKQHWAPFIPRISLIVPTGNVHVGSGYGGWGSQLNLAVTKRLTWTITTHYNVGTTMIADADHYTYFNDGTVHEKFERDLLSLNTGASVVWQARPRFNLLVEYVSSTSNSIGDEGLLVKTNLTCVNPGLRSSFIIGDTQFVPGISLPQNFSNGSFSGTGVLIYVSFEFH